jgi:hypothetical protein
MPPLYGDGIEVIQAIAHQPGTRGKGAPDRYEILICTTGSITNASYIVEALRRRYGTPHAAITNAWPLVTFFWRRSPQKPIEEQETRKKRTVGGWTHGQR